MTATSHHGSGHDFNPYAAPQVETLGAIGELIDSPSSRPLPGAGHYAGTFCAALAGTGFILGPIIGLILAAISENRGSGLFLAVAVLSLLLAIALWLGLAAGMVVGSLRLRRHGVIRVSVADTETFLDRLDRALKRRHFRREDTVYDLQRLYARPWRDFRFHRIAVSASPGLVTIEGPRRWLSPVARRLGDW